MRSNTIHLEEKVSRSLMATICLGLVAMATPAYCDLWLEYSRVPSSYLNQYDRGPGAFKSPGALSDRSYVQQPNGFEREIIRSQYYRLDADAHKEHFEEERLPVGRLNAPFELYGENKYYDLRSGLEVIYDSMREPVYIDAQHERALRYDHSLENPFEIVTKEYHERVRRIWDARLSAWSKQETRHQAKRAIQRADSASFPMKLMRKFKKVLGGSDMFGGKDEADPAITDMRSRNDIAVHREEYERREREKYLHSTYGTYEPGTSLAPPKEPEKLRFRSRMNALKRQGNVTIENPLITTGANYDQRARDRIELKARRQIPLVQVESTFSYGLKHKTVAMNMYKQLSPEWSCEFNATKSDHSDIQTQQTLRFNYLFRF